MPLAAVAGISALGSIGSALIGSHSASDAAKAQMDAANKAAGIQLQGSNNALNYQNGIYNQTQQNFAPYLQQGGGALSQLSNLLGINPNTSIGQTAPQAQGLNPQTAGQTTSVPRLGGALNPSGTPAMPQSGVQRAVPGGSSLSLSGGPSAPVASPALGVGSAGSSQPGGGFGSLTQGYGQTFQAPTDITEQNDPGYQARMKFGTDAIQRSAAARGGVLTGGTAKALDQFGQDYASNEYGNVYNRAQQTYGTNYGVWNNDNNNIFSRLMGLTGVGQSAANSLAGAGQASANNVTGNLLGTGQQIGQDYGNAGQANASGIYNSGAAWQGALGGIGNNLSQLYQLQQLQKLQKNPYGGVNQNSNIPGVAG
jgi:hypothetical protein